MSSIVILADLPGPYSFFSLPFPSPIPLLTPPFSSSSIPPNLIPLNKYIGMYICIYMYICMYICVYMYVYMCIYMYICTYVLSKMSLKVIEMCLSFFNICDEK